MKRYIIFCIVLFIAVVSGSSFYLNNYVNENYVVKKVEGKNISTMAIVNGNKIYQVNNNKELEEIFIKGVNIGLGKPNEFPGEVAISKTEYLQWFKNIKDMGADYIRVYTLQSPDFYDALYDFNMFVSPLYLIQGAYLNEGYIDEYNDVYHPKIANDFTLEIENVINAVHGNAKIDKRSGHAYGEYKSDVSKYTCMYILGIEFSGDTIEITNSNNSEKKKYDGKYLYTENATPFEVFLANNGDYAIDYETKNYSRQTIIGFANWPTSDPLEHPNEPEDINKMMGFDVEHIYKTNNYLCGMIAAYHVYPYYPDFLNFEDQSTFLNEAKTNPYQDYLKRLRNHHTIPVIISEFGVPTSRGITHNDLSREFNQGGISEKDQGKAILSLTQDIKDAEMSGAIIFSWQDEWFKRTWNTMELTDSTGRAMWHDVQTSETSFGLMSFEPKNEKLLSTKIMDDTIDLKIYSNAAYLTLVLKISDSNIDDKSFELFFDTINTSGFSKLDTQDLQYPMDFYLSINDEIGELFVDPYYDNFIYLFGKQLNEKLPLQKNSIYSKNELNPIRLRLRNRIRLPESGKEIEPSYYATGKLTYGSLDMNDDSYNCLNDFHFDKNHLEIRIAWELLNFSDPSKGLILDDFYENYIQHVVGVQMKTKKIESFELGIKYKGKIDYVNVPIKNWDTVSYTERLKESYYIVKEVWANE